jgi:kynurenine formamidase
MYLWSLPEVTTQAKIQSASWIDDARISLLYLGLPETSSTRPEKRRKTIEVMRIQTFVIGSVLALALFLFAQQRPGTVQPGGFREVVDLTHSLPTHGTDPAAKSAYRLQTVAITESSISSSSIPASSVLASEQFATRMDAPARLVQGSWTVDQIPAGRLIAPLVVLDVKASVTSNPDYEVSVGDIVSWEQANGPIPLGAVVMARTGWGFRWNSARNYRNADAKGVMHFPGYSEDAARFLAEGRNALGLGIDTANLDRGSSKKFPVDHYTLSHGLYVLTNVANLDRMPANGAVAMVAPMKLTGGSAAPVRILALVR